ncbi:MAG: hypothetical protein M3251_00460 [Thermoproteota archaeon]|nr:hypothetical protein [Thermoproteota archaeon]
MNPEMNNNDRKNHSKTLAIAGMGFLLIATAFTFSFANSGQQLVNAQQNQTQTIVAVPFDTFTGSGPITATIGQGGQQQGGGNATAGGGNATAGGGNQTNTTTMGQTVTGQEPPYILGGNWNLNVQGGNVTAFTANFAMVHPDGTEYHTHNITNYRIGNATVQLVQGQETSISGTADVYRNGTNMWPGTNTTLTFTQNGAVMTIMPAPEDTDNHFQGQPIYGIVSALTGENGTLIAQTTPPGQQQEQQQQEEEEGGGPLAPLTEPFQDLFGGGGGQ